MTKEAYIQEQKLTLTKSFLSLLLLYGIPIIMLLNILDRFVTPENSSKFLIYRIIASVLFIPLYLINNKYKGRAYQIITVILSGLIVSTMVELMIFSFGGHQSPYYAGFIIIFIFMFGFLPLFSVNTTIFIATLIYAIYLVPIIIFDNITNIRIFLNNNIFLLTNITIGIVWRHYNDTLLVKKLSLEYDLDKDKQQLQIYSHQLEDLVAERTKDLTISEQRFRELFDNANDGVAVLNSDGIILDVNQKFCELHGFEKDSLIGANFKLLEVEDQKAEKTEKMKRLLNGEAIIFETEHYRSDGNRIFLEVSSKAIEIGGELYIQSMHRDITERKKMHEQLIQSQKMESLGILAGGLAHDFNNILTGILGHAELLHEYGDLDYLAKQKVKTIETAARRAGQMITRILNFARKGTSEMLPISLNNVINDTIELISKMLSHRKIGIKMEINERIDSIYGDTNQLEQVIMNLMINAADAMPDGGTITISTSLIDTGKESGRENPQLPPGKYVILKISDTGKGIPDEIKSKIFEPFFSTKREKGTGLGLAMVYGIVKEHKGMINMESEQGKGTTFEIYLPAADRFAYRVERPSTSPMAGKEGVMVIDDEAEVLSFLKETLEINGYKVLATDNPIYALDIFKQIYENIELVITDIVMPLVNGRELIKHFKMIKPEVKVIAISGYDTMKKGKKDREIDAFINKPFEGVYLLSVVRRVLNSKVSKGKGSGLD